MKSLDVINGLHVASPCPASWNAMEGDDRARFCTLCAKHVYNIAAMTSPEVEALIVRTEGHFCARVYQRRDGTVLTGDCPVGLRAIAARRVYRALTAAVLGLGFLMALALRPASRRPAPPPPPTGPGVTFDNWSDWALESLGLRPPTPQPRLTPGEVGPAPVLMGKILAPTPRACDMTPPVGDVAAEGEPTSDGPRD